MRWKSGPGGRRSGPEGPVLAYNAWLLSGRVVPATVWRGGARSAAPVRSRLCPRSGLRSMNSTAE
ncbi:hypothetical protein P376_5340 [Streptomyces sp. HCCB10043]|nr:hypothetical protein P376_5340 [Streptomyces sp. HCCB10043]